MYPVAVVCKRRPKWRVRRRLKKYGLTMCNGGYTGNISKASYKSFSIFCEKYHLDYRIDNGFGKRSSDYRAQYFRENRPPVGSFYICAYCGRLVSFKNVTVDHLYPVGRAKKDPHLQKKLRRSGIENINDPKNLVASCRRCNQKKGKKTGFWIVRGKIGRYPAVWLMRYAVRAALVLLFLHITGILR